MTRKNRQKREKESHSQSDINEVSGWTKQKKFPFLICQRGPEKPEHANKEVWIGGGKT